MGRDDPFPFAAGCRQGLAGARGQHAGDRVVFGLGDPRVIVGLDGDLASDVLAAEALVLGQPGGGVAVALGAIGRGVNGQQIQRVVGERHAALLAPLLRALLPRVRQGDDVVDVDLVGAATLERDPCRRVGVVELSRPHSALVQEPLGSEVAVEHPVAGLATADRLPAVTVLSARVPGLGRASLHGQRVQRGGRAGAAVDRCGAWPRRAPAYWPERCASARPWR